MARFEPPRDGTLCCTRKRLQEVHNETALETIRDLFAVLVPRETLLFFDWPEAKWGEGYFGQYLLRCFLIGLRLCLVRALPAR